jgi:hypothetical protein
MNCSKVLDMVYEYSGGDPDREDPMPLLNQIQIWLHTIICPACAQEIERYQVTRDIMREDFFPSSPELEDAIMARIAGEEELNAQEPYAAADIAAGGLSFRGWAIAGLIILISLATSFFGLDFQKVADETGISFLLPVGITIGIVLTTYGAFFIGSHLKELSERFDL